MTFAGVALAFLRFFQMLYKTGDDERDYQRASKRDWNYESLRGADGKPNLGTKEVLTRSEWWFEGTNQMLETRRHQSGGTIRKTTSCCQKEEFILKEFFNKSTKFKDFQKVEGMKAMKAMKAMFSIYFHMFHEMPFTIQCRCLKKCVASFAPSFHHDVVWDPVSPFLV